jgi:hypothetical protein
MMAIAQDLYPASSANALLREPIGFTVAGPILPCDGSARPITATFSYVGADLADAGQDVAQGGSFESRFYQDLKNLRAWSAQTNWCQILVPDFQVFVSTEYKISRALVHVWAGHRGRMEFPVWRVMSCKAAITHELVHVLFPNGNRFLAEGLAVYLQAAIGGNPAFPNFAQPLHERARELLQEMIPEFLDGDPKSLEQLHLSELDEIATPSPLTLRVGQDLYGEEPRGQARIYSIAGSFVQFLMETRGTEKFGALYEQTPLVPLGQNAGASDRWRNVYDVSLLNLEDEWKSMIVGGDTSTFGEVSIGGRAGLSVKSQHLECNRENGDA